MPRYIPALAARSVPRYTSYPTAAEFHGGVGVAEQAAALDAVPRDAPVSLYVHVPYCHQICWYCGCNTGASNSGQRLDAYVAALTREIETVAARMRGRVGSIHFGGGSPNALPAADFARLVETIARRFTVMPDAEIAVEIDPRGFDAAYAAVMAAAGVSRISLGVQTFAGHVQQRIGRVQPHAQIVTAVAALRGAGIDRINFDLMYGLPGQGVADVAETIDAAVRLLPDRIAMFGYAHMPAMLPRQRMIDAALLPDAEARFGQSETAHRMLVDAGYQAIGFDHYARPDDALARAARAGGLRRNFQGFTDEAGDAVIGLGASAISQFDGLLIQNEKHVGRYRMRAGNGALAGVRGIARTAEDRLRGAIIERLLCDGTVDVAEVARDRGLSPCRLIGALERLHDHVVDGLVAIRGWEVAIAPDALPYARVIASAFDRYRGAAEPRFSRAV